MADYFTHAVMHPYIPDNLVTDEECAKLKVFGFDSESAGDNRLYFYAEEYSASGGYCGKEKEGPREELEEDDLIDLLRGVIKRSNGSLQFIAIEMCFSCSKMRPDGFGGAAVFITANNALWQSTSYWLERKEAQLEKRLGRRAAMAKKTAHAKKRKAAPARNRRRGPAR